MDYFKFAVDNARAQAISAAMDHPIKQMEALLERWKDAEPEWVAEQFCDMNDEKQARTIIAIARKMRAFGGGGHGQLWAIGGHLKNCKCSTDEARRWVEELAVAVKESNHE